MAFVTETGDGLPNANAYITVAFADTYHADRGRATWADVEITDELKQVAIVLATDYIDKRFAPRFRGERKSLEQALEWPRLGAYDNAGHALTGTDAVPRKLQQACAEYALRALTIGELAPDPARPTQTDGTPTQTGELKVLKRRVGPVEREFEFRTPSEISRDMGSNRASLSDLVSNLNIPEYPAADLLIDPLLKSSSNRRIYRG